MERKKIIDVGYSDTAPHRLAPWGVLALVGGEGLRDMGGEGSVYTNTVLEEKGEWAWY